ncbi:hypothetical protein QYE76_025772 [Lolium multiflorum]|uniref:Retrotransposon Copia-like N-terminal domain-containing protein n=1 Tax=Lolium multiflorum TaxID=4521 RepID=A0AAD8VWY8_LOLMU|nr:hypothetical protein QYE76_025772 [Lolium multiflorum]
MELTAITDGTSSAPAAASAAVLVPAGAPRHAGPVILSFAAGNYSKWCIYMRASLGRSGYLGHVDGTVAAAPTNAEWATADYTVLNHLHAAIDEDVADMILAGNQTARQLWLAARDLFTANKANKAIYLDNDFRQLVQGSLSIHEYCRRQKHLADALSDNDSPVSDRALVLNTLRGLGPRFASAATVISMTDPLPTFLRTRAMLLMEEMQQANAAATSANTALVAQARGPASSCPGPGCRGDGPALVRAPGKASAGQAEGPHGGRQGGGATQGTQPARAPAPTGPWVCFSPGAGQWRAPSSGQGILGPRPQAYTATASSTSATTWDSSALIAALNNLALQQGGWVMDSGASSHMTNGDGNLTRSSTFALLTSSPSGMAPASPLPLLVSPPFAHLLVTSFDWILFLPLSARVAVWGPAGLANNGGGHCISSRAKMQICRCLSSSIWRMCRVPEGSVGAPLDDSSLEVAGSGGIRSSAPMFYSGRLVTEEAFRSSAGGYYHGARFRSVVLAENDMEVEICGLAMVTRVWVARRNWLHDRCLWSSGMWGDARRSSKSYLSG